MNPHRRYKSYMHTSDILLIILPIILILFAAFGLNPIHKKNTEKLPQNKPIDRQTISTDNITGNVESIHPWGRTEVVPMKSIKLEYFEFCDEWVMYGEVVQPTGRKGYFMPVMDGRLNFSVRDRTQTWIEYGSYSTSPDTSAETYEDFRVADIRVKEGKIINILYKHYRLDQNKTWSIIVAWEAKFSENIQRRN